jgi:hypothetical protein
MRALSWLFAAVFILASLSFFAFAMMVASTSSSAQICKLTSYGYLITPASLYVNEFRLKESRLPTLAEFETWKKTSKDGERYEGYGFSYHVAPFPLELVKKLGKPTEGAYTLTFWGGDSWVTYASWFGDGSKGYIPDSEYFVFGGKKADAFVFGSVGLLFFGFSVLLLRVGSWLMMQERKSASEKQSRG